MAAAASHLAAGRAGGGGQLVWRGGRAFPNTQCLPSRKEVSEVQMKNWEPFVFGPALAIERVPGAQKGRVRYLGGAANSRM